MKISIVGVGPGTDNYLLPIAREELGRASCLVGAKRLLSLFKDLGKEEVPIEGHFDKIIPFLKKYKDKKRIAVLVTGDPGIHSLLEKISKSLKPGDYKVIPGISTLQLAFAKIGESWQEAKVVSLHGRKFENLVDCIKQSPKVFLFTDHEFPPDKIAASLLKEGLENRRTVALENLSYPNERIIDSDLKRLSKIKGWGLSVMIIEGTPPHQLEYNRSKMGNWCGGKLYGIGIGPGDPRLLTLKAKEVLDSLDTIFAPRGNEDGASLAHSIVESVTETRKNFIELTFPMTKDKALLNKYWKEAATRIAKEIKKGRACGFVTIGDPFIYSTYVYLLKTIRKYFPQIEIETVPGITSFNAASAASNFSLVEADERLAVLPVRKDLSGLREAFEKFDTVVLMKVGSKLAKVISLLRELGLISHSILVSRVGHTNQRIVYNLNSLQDKKIGYLSVIIVKK